MADPVRLFIGGEWIERGKRDVIPVLDPATGEAVAELTMATEDDLGRTLEAASAGFAAWRAVPAAERARLLHETARLIRERTAVISRTLTLEQGKTLSEAAGEVMVTAAYMDELAELGARINGRLLQPEPNGVTRTVLHEPVGPVFAVSPWNLPAMMPGRKIATSLAAGCSVVVKPAKETPQTAYLLAACCQDAGIPDGVVNVVSGPSSLISDTMIGSGVIRKVSFTGSTEVGKQLAAAAGSHMKKVTMELGGHAPVIVCDDVDVETAVSALVPARYHNAGQSCMAATRFFVHERIYEDFARQFTAGASALRVGDGIDESTDMGPLTSERRLPVMETMVEDAVRAGAILAAGGARADRRGFFFEPTVLTDVPDTADRLFLGRGRGDRSRELHALRARGVRVHGRSGPCAEDRRLPGGRARRRQHDGHRRTQRAVRRRQGQRHRSRGRPGRDSGVHGDQDHLRWRPLRPPTPGCAIRDHIL
jgi:succinate-semialdehyde dehydrogenase/glutarate-semialdehyde dehydrogenase